MKYCSYLKNNMTNVSSKVKISLKFCSSHENYKASQYIKSLKYCRCFENQTDNVWRMVRKSLQYCTLQQPWKSQGPYGKSLKLCACLVNHTANVFIVTNSLKFGRRQQIKKQMSKPKLLISWNVTSKSGGCSLLPSAFSPWLATSGGLQYHL